MNFLLTLRVAARALAKNKLRAGLTVLGVVIGIASVTTMVSLGQSASSLVKNTFQSFGTNLIIIFPAATETRGRRDKMGTAPSLTIEDCDAVGRLCKNVLAITPFQPAGGQVVYGALNWSPRELIGVGEQYPIVRNWKVRPGGSFFTEQDIASGASVCVIGHTIVRKLFQTTNPIGETIRIANIPFEIIGVLETKGASLGGEDQDDIVLLPHSTVRNKIYRAKFGNTAAAALASARSSEVIEKAVKEIQQLLMERHRIAPGSPPDFEVRSSTEVLNNLNVITGTLTMMLAGIAGISLLVGGVGIMNIMLVSVTERTREIGIRMAIGATSGDILRQFLVEAVLLSLIGGIVGLLMGIGASIGATMAINSMVTTESAKWPIVVSIPAAIGAIVFAAMVGIVFGFLPARRASRLDPIEALRYE